MDYSRRNSRTSSARIHFLPELEKIRKTVNLLLSKRQEYYEKALEALHRKYNFELTATYQSTTTDQALLDATFDFSDGSAAVLNFFQQALQGKLDDLFLTHDGELPSIPARSRTASAGKPRWTSRCLISSPLRSTSTSRLPRFSPRRRTADYFSR